MLGHQRAFCFRVWVELKIFNIDQKGYLYLILKLKRQLINFKWAFVWVRIVKYIWQHQSVNIARLDK